MLVKLFVLDKYFITAPVLITTCVCLGKFELNDRRNYILTIGNFNENNAEF